MSAVVTDADRAAAHEAMITDEDAEAAYPIVGTVYRLTGLGMSGMAEVQGMIAQAIADAREAGERAGAERERSAIEERLRGQRSNVEAFASKKPPLSQKYWDGAKDVLDDELEAIAAR